LAAAYGSARRLAELPLATQLSVPACRQVSKALKSGPVPADPDIRDVAVGLGERILRSSATATKVLPLAAAFVVLSQAAILLEAPHRVTGLGLVTAVVFTAQGVYYWIYPKLIEARVQLMRAYGPR
jgi:hypothetical protein